MYLSDDAAATRQDKSKSGVKTEHKILEIKPKSCIKYPAP